MKACKDCVFHKETLFGMSECTHTSATHILTDMVTGEVSKHYDLCEMARCSNDWLSFLFTDECLKRGRNFVPKV